VSTWVVLGLIFAGFFVNLLFSLAGFWYLSFEYRKRFAALAEMMESALKYRDAKLGELKAMLVKGMMTDTNLFDSLLDDDPLFNEDEADGEDNQDDVG
jgi:hypothetical protein